MSIRKFIGFVLILTSVNYILCGQINDNYWERLQIDIKDFKAVTDTFNKYIITTYPDSIPSDKISNFKEYYRFYNFWKSRLGLINDTTSIIPYRMAVINNSSESFCSSSDLANWELVGPVSMPLTSNEYIMGLVGEIIHDPQLPNSFLVSSENGGIWKSQMSGNSWKNVTDNLNFPGLQVTEFVRNPFNNNHIIASTSGGKAGDYGMGIIESFDNGETWQIQSSFPYQSYPAVEKVIYDPNSSSATALTLYAITRNENEGKLYTSYNSGSDWQSFSIPPIPEKTLFHDLEIDEQGSLYASTTAKYNNLNGGVYKYSEGLWSEVSFDGIQFQQARITKPFGGKIFVMLDNCHNDTVFPRKIFKTTDYSATWELIKEFSLEYDFLYSDKNKDELEYSSNSNIIYIGSILACAFKDEPNYTHIEIPIQHMDVRDFDIIGIDNLGMENILVADDGGASLLMVNVATLSSNIEDLNGNFLPIGNFMGLGQCGSPDEFIVTGAVHNHSFKYENGVWTNFSSGDGGDCEVNWDRPNVYYYQDNSKMEATEYNGNSLFYFASNWFIGMEYELHPKDPYLVYFGRASSASAPALLIKFNQKTGEIFQRFAPGSNDFKVDAVGAIGINSNNVIFIADYSIASETTPFRLNKSFDDGLSWTDLSFNPVYELISNNWITQNNLAQILAWSTVEDIVFNPENPDEVWIGIGGVKTGNTPNTGKFRVLHSTDLGATWYDYSENLPPFPVMSLEFQEGSTGRLFAGTDAGVYYRDQSMSQWECFNTGLPIALITDIDYDICSNTLYVSTQGRGIFKTLVPFDNHLQVTLTQNEIWEDDRVIAGDLIIPAGITLTIRSKVYFAKDSKIHVQKGGKLTIDGGVLTDRCNGFWQGIEVYGNPSLPQTPASQGLIELINGATIENAWVAIRLGRTIIPEGDGEINYGDGGGMIYATEAVFLNNNISVVFEPYSFPNSGSFNLCNFNSNTATTDLNNFITLNSVSGVRIKGCEFTGSETMNGVISNNSVFYIERYCFGPEPCNVFRNTKFVNLKYAIKAYAFSPTKPCFISNSEFESNKRSIYLSAVQNASVSGNIFSMILSPFNPPDADTLYGVYLDMCSGYQIHDNYFESSQQQNEKVIAAGLVINQSGEANNLVYDNTFNTLYTGVLAQNENRSASGLTGLMFKCNQFANSSFDIAITKSSPLGTPKTGIAKYQGANLPMPDAPAGNRFSWTGPPGVPTDINNQAQHITYYYHNGYPSIHLEPKYYTPLTVRPFTVSGAVWNENSCPPLSQFASSEESLRMAIANSDYQSDSIAAIIDLLEDGGNTETLVQEVVSGTPPESMQIYSELMSASPFTSDTVVSAAIENENVLFNAMIRDVMVANPQSAKSDVLLEKLDHRSNPLPDYMISQILQGRSLVSVYEHLQSKLSFFAQKKAWAFQNLVNKFLTDSVNTVTNYDSLIVLLNSEISIETRYQLGFLYLEKGYLQQGFNILNEMPGQFSFTTEQNINHQNLVDFCNLIGAINGFKPDPVQLAGLQDIEALNSGSASVFARNYLLYLDATAYSEPFYFPDFLKSSEEIRYEHLIQAQAEDDKPLTVFPNPSSSQIILSWKLDSEIYSGEISITDISGKVISRIPVEYAKNQLVVDTRKLTSGTYMATLRNNDKIIESVKFSIAK